MLLVVGIRSAKEGTSKASVILLVVGIRSTKEGTSKASVTLLVDGTELAEGGPNKVRYLHLILMLRHLRYFHTELDC